jgi:hypothetical protein
MKKFLFLALLAIEMMANAQWLVTDRTYRVYTGQTGDTAISGTNASVSWKVNIDKLYFYQVEASLDEITNGANSIAILYGSNDNTTYYEIDTLATTFTGTEAQSADGVVGLQDLTTGVMWRYLKVTQILSTTGKWDFDYIKVRTVGKYD